jgi:NADPH:quinone reductase-like Zn-dependent oxidoreductase
MSQLAALTALVDTGVVGVEVSRSFPLTELARVHRHAEAGELHGKVTIVPAPLSIHEKGGGANSAAYGR